MIPKFLYRGDSDKNGIRSLKETIDYYQLQTNLINGGSGRDIVEQPLLHLVHKHVGISWPLSHFLSFSEDKMTAIRYGLNCNIEDLEETLQKFDEHFFQDKTWDFVVITMDTNQIEWKTIGKGIYEGLYKPGLKKFNNLEKYRIICINVHEALELHIGFEQSINNAKQDAEWLILPATLTTLNNNITEYSAILDAPWISERQKYKQNHQ